MLTLLDLCPDTFREIAGHLNPCDCVMFAFSTRVVMSSLTASLTRGLDPLVMRIYHYGTLQQMTYFEKKWREHYDDEIMISRWKGYLLRIVDDLTAWCLLPPFLGQFSLISSLHRYGILLWCANHCQWRELRQAIVDNYPEICDWIGGYCSDAYLEDLAVNFRGHLRPQKEKWLSFMRFYDGRGFWRSKIACRARERNCPVYKKEGTSWQRIYERKQKEREDCLQGIMEDAPYYWC